MEAIVTQLIQSNGDLRERIGRQDEELRMLRVKPPEKPKDSYALGELRKFLDLPSNKSSADAFNMYGVEGFITIGILRKLLEDFDG